MRPDRHGRAARADNDPRRRPCEGYRVRGAGRFRQMVADAVSTLPDRLADPLDDADIAVVDVPEEGARSPDGGVALAVFAQPVLTVYRRPLEARASDRDELESVVRLAVGWAVADALGLTDGLDDLLDDD